MQIVPFVVFVVVGLFSPGPNVVMSLNAGRTQGFKASVPFLAGMAVGFALIMFLTALFNLYLTRAMPTIRPFLGAVGALYMLWLAAKQFLPRKPRIGPASTGGSRPFFTGFALQFINPKVILYGLAIMASFILPHYDAIPAVAFFSLVLGSICLVSLSCWAYFGVLFQRCLASHETALNVAMALLLAYCAYSVSGLDVSRFLSF